MSPFFTRQNRSNLLVTNFVMDCVKYLVRGKSKIVTHSPDFPNFGFLEFARPFLNPLGLSPLRNHIGKILIGISNPQMRRIYTRWIVSVRAIMAHDITGLEWPEVDHVIKGVRMDIFSHPITSESVSFARRYALPYPARIGYDNPLEEYGQIRWGNLLNLRIPGTTISLHNQFVWLCHALGCFNSARAPHSLVNNSGSQMII